MISIIDYFEEKVDKYGDHPLLWEKRDGRFQSLTYKETHERVVTLTSGLLALGVEKGDRIALL